MHEASLRQPSQGNNSAEVNNLRKQLEETKKKVDEYKKQVDEKKAAVADLEQKLKVDIRCKYRQVGVILCAFY